MRFSEQPLDSAVKIIKIGEFEEYPIFALDKNKITINLVSHSAKQQDVDFTTCFRRKDHV